MTREISMNETQIFQVATASRNIFTLGKTNLADVERANLTVETFDYLLNNIADYQFLLIPTQLMKNLHLSRRSAILPYVYIGSDL